MPKYDFPNKTDAPEERSDIYTPSTTYPDERSDIYTPSPESLVIVNDRSPSGNHGNTTSGDTASSMRYYSHAHCPVPAPLHLAHAAVPAFPVSTLSPPPQLPNGQVINAKNTLHNNGNGTDFSNRNKAFRNDYGQHEQLIVEAQVLSSSFVDHNGDPYGAVSSGSGPSRNAVVNAATAESLSNGGYYGNPEMPAAPKAVAAAEVPAANKPANSSNQMNTPNHCSKIKAIAMVGAAATTIVLVILLIAILKASDSNNDVTLPPRPLPTPWPSSDDFYPTPWTISPAPTLSWPPFSNFAHGPAAPQRIDSPPSAPSFAPAAVRDPVV